MKINITTKTGESYVIDNVRYNNVGDLVDIFKKFSSFVVFDDIAFAINDISTIQEVK